MSAQHGFEVVLIAPVGTREVTLTDLSLLPDDDLRVHWKHADPKQRTGARTKGEVLSASLDRYAPALSLDILGKAVRHVFQAHGHIDRLILVASDQPETTPEKYRQNDTIELARLIKKLLLQDPALKPVGDRVKIMPVTDNPSSYGVMRDFYRQRLPIWCRDLKPEGVCYLEVTGGTAQMSTMLLLEGVRLLGPRAVPIYVLEEYDMPQTLDVGRQMLVDELKETLRRDLSIYAYHAAWKSAVEGGAVVRGMLPHYDALVAVLDCARHRLNFDFATAQSALFGADQGLPAPLKARVMALAHELSEDGRTKEWLIAEVFHSAMVRLRMEAYASFVGRVFRFQEAMLRYLCEKWGARFGGKNEAFVEPSWLAAHQGVRMALDKAQIYADREVSRATLQVLALQLTRERGDERGQSWVKRLARFEQVASLRNQLAITHGFSGVSLQKLAELYKGGAPQVVADMEALLSEVLGVKGSDNPYERLNALCYDLLEGK
jgi:hypothetical protein